MVFVKDLVLYFELYPKIRTGRSHKLGCEDFQKQDSSLKLRVHYFRFFRKKKASVNVHIISKEDFPL